MLISELLMAAKPFLSYLNSGVGEPSGSLEIPFTEAPSGSQEIPFTEAPSGNPLEIVPAGVSLANYASYVGQKINSPNYISYVGASLSKREAFASTSSSYASSKEGLHALGDSFKKGEGETAEEVNSLLSPAPLPEERAPTEHVADQEQFPAPADGEFTPEAQQEISVIGDKLYISKKTYRFNFIKNSLALAKEAEEIYKFKLKISACLQQIFPEFAQMDARIIRENILIPKTGGGLEFSIKTLSLIYADIDRLGRDSKWAVKLLRQLDNYRLFG